MSSDAWTEHSKVYDEAFRPILETFAREAIALSGLSSTQECTVLDVACGSGAATLPLLEKGHKISATDYSQGMLDIVKSRATKAGFHELEAALSDGQVLEGFPDAHYDAVVSSFGIFLFPDRVQGWKSAHRVLKPGGKLVALSWSRNSANLQIIDHIMDKKSAFQSENATLEKDSFKKEVSSCGFRSVSVTEITHEFGFTSGRLLLDSMLDNPVFRKATEHLGRQIISTKMAEYLRLPVEIFLDKPVQYQGTALLCLAEK
jgi:ubiquinone/menaquinone biosynthesis C-methylase UbiE